MFEILVGDMLARYQPDALRYFICAAGPENQDANFTWRDFVQRNNSELVAGWGNLVSRTAAMPSRTARRVFASVRSQARGRTFAWNSSRSSSGSSSAASTRIRT